MLHAKRGVRSVYVQPWKKNHDKTAQINKQLQVKNNKRKMRRTKKEGKNQTNIKAMIAHDDEQAVSAAAQRAAEGIVGGPYQAFAHHGFPVLHSPTQCPSLHTQANTLPMI